MRVFSQAWSVCKQYFNPVRPSVVILQLPFQADKCDLSPGFYTSMKLEHFQILKCYLIGNVSLHRVAKCQNLKNLIQAGSDSTRIIKVNHFTFFWWSLKHLERVYMSLLCKMWLFFCFVFYKTKSQLVFPQCIISLVCHQALLATPPG